MNENTNNDLLLDGAMEAYLSAASQKTSDGAQAKALISIAGSLLVLARNNDEKHNLQRNPLIIAKRYSPIDPDDVEYHL